MAEAEREHVPRECCYTDLHEGASFPDRKWRGRFVSFVRKRIGKYHHGKQDELASAPESLDLVDFSVDGRSRFVCFTTRNLCCSRAGDRFVSFCWFVGFRV